MPRFKPPRYKVQRLSTRSPVPAVFLTREATNEMKKAMVDMPKRVDRGRQLFLLEMARVMREHIRNLAPKVKVGGEPTDYARDLRIAILEGVKDSDAVALWYEDTQVEVTESEAGNTMLFFRLLPTSPEWVNVLIRFGPWPAEILPVHVGNEHAKIVSRRARTDEVAAISKRLYDRRGEIEALLGAAGARGAAIKRSGNGVGLMVREDVGFNVLRKEFGMDGEKQESHWRPALRAIMEESKIVAQKFIRYLETGHEGVFDLPSDVDEIPLTRYKKGQWFQAELAPFSPKG